MPIDTPEGGPGNKFFSCVYKEEPSGDGPITYDPCPVRFPKDLCYSFHGTDSPLQPPHEEVSFVDKYDITVC